MTKDMEVWAAGAHGTRIYTEIDWRLPSALIIGSEAHGASNKAISLARGTVAVPMSSDVESLNAAMAAGIILFEAARQKKSE
jgi:TrmH family RNA methyltransferase